MINEGEKSNKIMEETKTIAESRMFQTCHVKPPIVVSSGIIMFKRLVGSMAVVLFVVWLISINQLGCRRKANYHVPILQGDVPRSARKKGRYL